MGDPKLAPGSALSVSDVERLCREEMGAEALERQRKLAEREREAQATARRVKSGKASRV